ncbi:MAG: hypothetical protein R3B09_07920 [Nannocystaceae bacterium]
MPAVAALPDPSSPVPSALSELLAVFAEALSDVRFPGVDHDALSALSAQAQADDERVRALQADLAAAEAALADTQERLLRAAELGLAYARVYAGDDADLQGRLAAIHLAGAGPRRRKLELAGAPQGSIKLPPRRPRKARSQADAPA